MLFVIHTETVVLKVDTVACCIPYACIYASIKLTITVLRITSRKHTYSIMLRS